METQASVLPIKVSTNYAACPFWPELGEEFYDLVRPAAFPQATLRFRNQAWAERVGLGEMTSADWQRAFWAFEALPNNLPQPMALRYHGHQFMSYNPNLGDGRGFLYAQLQDSLTTKKLDLGTKGSGQTPWSRRGDGRLTLKGAVREALATAMLEALGVNTSKTFSIFETGENLERGDEPSPTRSAVLTRLSHGHVRIGTFQRLAFLEDKAAMEKLFQFCLKHYYPEIDASSPDAIEEFFKAVAKNIARTTAQLMLAGFVHGVLNTDNINITGECFDYGPYRFLPHYDVAFTAAYFDHSGLYAYGQQPRILLWNLEQLKKSLALIAPDEKKLESGYEVYQDEFTRETFRYFLKRLNLKDPRAKADEIHTADMEKLLLSAIGFLDQSKVSFQGFFFDFLGGESRLDQALKSPRKNHYAGPASQSFLTELQKFAPANETLLKDSYFLGTAPQDLLIDEIESIWTDIDSKDDWTAFNKKLAALDNLKSLNQE